MANFKWDGIPKQLVEKIKTIFLGAFILGGILATVLVVIYPVFSETDVYMIEKRIFIRFAFLCLGVLIFGILRLYNAVYHNTRVNANVGKLVANNSSATNDLTKKIEDFKRQVAQLKGEVVRSSEAVRDLTTSIRERNESGKTRSS